MAAGGGWASALALAAGRAALPQPAKLALSGAPGHAADATRFDDSPEILPDGRITNAEMRRDAAALRAALAPSDLAPRLAARHWEPPSRGAGASGPGAGAPTARE
eukprot:8058952-Alexandrium_andersonii.AAC.1